MTPPKSTGLARTIARTAAAKLRAWFDPPLEDDARPLEIRRAIVEQVEQLTEPAAAGRRVLPRNRVAVTLLARDKASRELLEAALADIEVDVRARLTELRCPPPHGFGIDLAYVKKPRPEWSEGQRVAVDLVNAAGGKAVASPAPGDATQHRASDGEPQSQSDDGAQHRPSARSQSDGEPQHRASARSQSDDGAQHRASARSQSDDGAQHRASARSKSTPRPPGSLPLLRITVRRGATTQRDYIFSEPRVLIGRTAAPVDRAGRPRHNHVVFLDEGSEHNATVGRAHASIQFEPDRHQFRLFDDGSHNGTRIVRGGDTIDITPHNPVGVALLSGDEIQFGTAAVLVTIEDGQ